MMRSNLTRRTILQAVGAGALAPSAPPRAGAAQSGGEGAGTPKICLELSGRLQAAALDEAGMRRVKQLGVNHVAMGGRLDATNVVDPLLSIITDISLDHTEWLGTTLAAIAREKAGILRPGGRMIRLPQFTEADDVLREIAKELGVRWVSVIDYLAKGLGAPGLSAPCLGAPGPSHLGTWECITPIDSLLESTAAPYTVNALGASIEVASPLDGAHQQRNIALAIAAAVELACEFGFPIRS